MDKKDKETVSKLEQLTREQLLTVQAIVEEFQNYNDIKTQK